MKLERKRARADDVPSESSLYKNNKVNVVSYETSNAHHIDNIESRKKGDEKEGGKEKVSLIRIP